MTDEIKSTNLEKGSSDINLEPFTYLSSTSTEGSGKTPLIQAVLEGNIDFVKKLIGRGEDVNLQDGDGMSPLHHACYLERYTLINNVRNIDYSKKRWMPYINSRSIISILLDNGANPLLKNKEDKTCVNIIEGIDLSKRPKNYKNILPLLLDHIRDEIELVSLMNKIKSDKTLSKKNRITNRYNFSYGTLIKKYNEKSDDKSDEKLEESEIIVLDTKGDISPLIKSFNFDL